MKNKPSKTGTEKRMYGRVKKHELSVFCRQFSVLIGAGVQVAPALATLSFQCSHGTLKSALTRVYSDVLSGRELYLSMAEYPSVFPSYLVSMIKIGLATGTLEKVLQSSAEYYEKEDKFEKKLKGVLAYPVFLAVLLFAVAVFVIFEIIPVFEETLSALGTTEIPWLTRAVFSFAAFVRCNYLAISVIAVIFLLSLILFFITSYGKLFLDKCKLKMPFISGVYKCILVSRFSSGLALQMKSGCDILECLENCSKILSNSYAEMKIMQATDSLKKGSTLCKGLRECGFYPEMFLEMVLVGEKSGALEDVLDSCASYYSEQSEWQLSKAVSAVQPIMLIGAGAMMVAVFASLYAPVIGMTSSF